MEAYRHAHLAHTRTSHLTKLYSDAKKSAVTSVIVQPDSTAQSAALHRKFRIQKDRLITWGLAWSDDEKGPDGNIDESVAKAGLTETVASVLRNVKEVTDELENLRLGYVKDGEDLGGAKQPLPFDEARYEDLLKDLTASIDTLYDLSRSRRALARGEHPTFSANSADTPEAAKPILTRKSIYRAPSIADSELTLVNPPSFRRPSLSPYAGLPPRIDTSALRLSPEGPPPYDSLGVPTTTRQIGKLIRVKASETVRNALGSSAAEVPVLVEYAEFDPTYRDTGVPPPLQRLEELSAAFQPMRAESQHNLSLIGYFEDSLQPRIGLVYDLPYAVQNQLQAIPGQAAGEPTLSSLLNFLRKRKQLHPTTPDVDPPALEDRFRLALRLTEQLHSMHQMELAHGNVNSTSVVFTTTSSELQSPRQGRLRSPIWASFDLFSKYRVEGANRTANLNIYKHPDDHPQTETRDLSQDIRYDLYGLALLLLEVGLWHPIGDFYKPKYTLADFKTRLERLWIPRLADRCGSAYMRAVQTCMRVADGNESSVTTVESVYDVILPYLHRCCLVDEGYFSVAAGALAAADPAHLFVPAKGNFMQARNQPPAGAPIPRQKSDPNKGSRTLSVSTIGSNQLLRSQSVSAVVPSMLHTLSSLSNLAATSLPMAYAGVAPANESLHAPQLVLGRPTQQLQSVSDLKDHLSRRISSTPSFQEYKRKVTIIQKRWRECHEMCRAAREDAKGTTATSHAADNVTDESNDLDDNAERYTRPKRQEFPSLRLPQAIIEDWHRKTAVELGRLVEKALKGSPESSSIGLTLYGETPETARPTYLVCCSSTAKVKHVLKRHFNFDPSVCDVKVKNCSIRRSRRSRRSVVAQGAMRSMAPNKEGEIEAANPDYQLQPLCGASIGAYRDESHLPPVSFGGIVLVDGRPYGMSVHHMLEADDEEEQEDDDDDQDAGSDTSSLASLDDVVSEDASTARQLSLASDTSDDVEDQMTNDFPGIAPGEGTDIEITQPALDDAIALNLHADEDSDEDDGDDGESGIDEDHILSYKLGQIHASSGLKRSTFHSTESGYSGISASLPQEIDWALFELLPPRVHPFNIVKGGGKYCTAGEPGEKDCSPVAIKDGSELAEVQVHCLARTSGLANGAISSTMELLKLHGRTTFSASWTVHGEFGVGGDSGAWIISNDGEVCGHVLAERQGRTYICPMDMLFKDIQTTLGAKQVSLPVMHDAKACVRGQTILCQTTDGSQNDVAAVMGKLRVSDREGGVALPSPPCSPERSCMFTRVSAALTSAG